MTILATLWACGIGPRTGWALNGALCGAGCAIALSVAEPLRKTPWLDDVLFAQGGPKLSAEQERQVCDLLGVTAAAPKGTGAPPAAVERAFELKDGEIREYNVVPQDFGLTAQGIDAIRVESVEQSKAMVLAALSNEPGAARDIVALNSGASIYAAGLAPTVAEGVKRAQAVIASGAARKKLDQFVAFTKSVKAE